MKTSSVHTQTLSTPLIPTLTPVVAFFSKSRIIPFLVVVIFAGVMAHTEYIATSSAMTQRFGEPPDWMDALMVLQWIAAFCTQIILWIVCVIIVQLMAVIFDGDGKFTDLLFLWGYGYLPLAATAVILFYVLSASTNAFSSMALSASKDIESLPGMPTTKMVSQFAQVFFVCWGIYTVSHVHHLSFIRAFLCLLIPIVTILLLRYFFNTIL